MNIKQTLECIALLSVIATLASCGGSDKKSTASSSITVRSAMANSAASSAASSSLVQTNIKLNQLGFQPNAEKLAVVPAVVATTFTIVNAGTETVVFTGELSTANTWLPALELVKLADFSALTIAGTYELRVVGVANPAILKISTTAYDALNAATVKAFYYNRASTALLDVNAGIYQRAAGHPDDVVRIHASAATDARPAGTIISAPKGWYDAGDYNKYIINASISTYMLMAAYEILPDYFNSQNLNIPESGDPVPDLLNEVMWNLEWMLAMQDPNDGGVYFKLTSKEFSGFVMPITDTSERYVVQKTTTSALDFAAVMAMASRIYAAHEATYPGKSAQMLAASKLAYTWAKANPAIYFSQPTDISTGAYGDGDVTDEFVWAAAELYITTKDDNYYIAMNPTAVSADVPWWGGVKSLGWVSLANNLNSLTSVADKELIRSRIDGVAASYAAKKAKSAYAVSMESGDFIWGSNSGAAGQAFMLLTAYRLDKTKTEYLSSAQSLLDYLLGRNATDYSFVTGFGSRSPVNIHHRPSASDGISAPIPGFLVGGPNLDQQDKNDCSTPYPSKIAAKSYVDATCSYASNEIAINWNAPMVFITAAIQVFTLDLKL
ncbi:MAG: glycoside hydrolase family 9 protein [Pseudomonadota bacterium]